MRRDTALVAFLDILLIILLMVIPLINIPTESEGKNLPLTLTVAWDNGVNVDIDSHMRIPSGDFMWFRNKDLGGVHIDKDDLGSTREALNREIILFDEPEDGEYFFSLHGYRYSTAEVELTCVVLMEDEKGRKLWEVVVACPKQGEELPIMRFTFVGGKLVSYATSHLKIIELRRNSYD